MRAHTITTKPRVEAGARTKRTILALSLVVVLLGATASAASATTTLSTTSTPPPPLTLSVSAKARVEKGYGRLLIFPATTSHASSLVVTGRKIQKTTYDLEPGVREWIHAEFKHLPRRDKVKVKIKATATTSSTCSAGTVGGSPATQSTERRLPVTVGGEGTAGAQTPEAVVTS